MTFSVFFKNFFFNSKPNVIAYECASKSLYCTAPNSCENREKKRKKKKSLISNSPLIRWLIDNMLVNCGLYMVKCGDCSRFNSVFFSSYDKLFRLVGWTILSCTHLLALVVNRAFWNIFWPAFTLNSNGARLDRILIKTKP